MTKNLSANAERIARHYWGEPNAKLSVKGRTLRWGTHGSKELDLSKGGTWYDFESDQGGGVIDIVKQYGKLGISGSVADVLERQFGIQKQNQSTLAPASYIQKIYSYFNADGAEAYQVLRMFPKTFRQRRPDGKGGYVYSMKGVELLPYNLVGIMQNPDAPIFIVEGEACADGLIALGLVATTNSGGAKKWDDALTQYFEGRDVVILPDNDNAGRDHAEVVTKALWGRARRIKRVELPNLQEKGDVVDWLAAGGDTGGLLELVKAAKMVSEDQVADVQPEDVAQVDAVDGELVIEPFATMDRDAVFSMPPVEFLVDQLLTETGFSMMYGSPGTGKSFVAIDIALSIAHGIAWQGFDAKPGAVLYIAGEGIGGFGKRWKAWEKHKAIKSVPDMYLLPTAVNFRDKHDIARLTATIKGLGKQFKLVIVDTVARALLGGEENSSTDMGLFVKACDDIKGITGGALLAVHHAGKDSTKGARGSTALLGAVDTSILIGKLDDVVSMKVEKQKDAEPIEAGLNFKMLTVPASISETSVVLQRIDVGNVSGKKPWRPSGNSKRALQILQNLAVDRGQSRVPYAVWTDKMRSDMPDTPATTRGSARDVLIEKEWVISVDGVCWKNNELTTV